MSKFIANQKRRRGAALGVLGLFLLSPFAAGQTPDKVSAANASVFSKAGFSQNEKRDLKQFDTALKLLAAQRSAAFVIEGEPYKKALSAAEVESVNLNAAPEQVLEQVVALYDYSVQRQKNAPVYVFKKRYSETDDLPYVSLEEALLTLRDLLSLNSVFSEQGKAKDGQRLADFGRSLTPEQTEALRDEKRGLRISELNAGQRAQIGRVALRVYADNTGLQMVSGQEKILSLPSTIVGWSKLQGMRFFGYGTFLDASHTSRYFRPLSHPDVVRSEGSGILTFLQATQTGTDITAPKEEKATPNENAQTQQSPPLGISLRDAVLQVSKDKGGSPVVVEDALAAHPVVLINEQAASEDALLRSLAAVYGFQLTTKADETRHISRPRLLPVKTLAMLPAALEQALPASFLRALHRKEKEAEYQEAVRDFENSLSAKASGVAKGKRPDTDLLLKKMRALETPVSALSLRLAAVRCLRTTVEPRMAAKQKVQIPLTELTDGERADLGIVVMSDIWPQVQNQLNPDLPDYVTHFVDGGPGDGILVGGFVKNTESGESKVIDSEKLAGFELRFLNKDASDTLHTPLVYKEMASPPAKKSE